MKKIQNRHIIYLVPEKTGTRYIFGIFGKEKMKDTVKQAFIATIPVLAGYLALGFGFGVLLSAGGYGVFHALIMSVFIFLFMGLGYRVPSYICLGGLYVLVGVFFIARKILEKKM